MSLLSALARRNSTSVICSVHQAMYEVGPTGKGSNCCSCLGALLFQSSYQKKPTLQFCVTILTAYPEVSKNPSYLSQDWLIQKHFLNSHLFHLFNVMKTHLCDISRVYPQVLHLALYLKVDFDDGVTLFHQDKEMGAYYGCSHIHLPGNMPC